MKSQIRLDAPDYLLTSRTLKQVTFRSTAAASKFNMIARVLTTVCLALLCLKLTLCQDINLTPSVPLEETTVNPAERVIVHNEDAVTHAAATDNGQPLELTCPNDNEDHFVSTSWYTCSGYGRTGLYRISEDKTNVMAYRVPDLGLADAHNITRDGTLLVTPRNCSQERVYICDRWANVGHQNQCWFFTVQNCTVRMLTTPARQCLCSSPRPIVTSGTAHSTMACGLTWLAIAVLTIIRI